MAHSPFQIQAKGYKEHFSIEICYYHLFIIQSTFIRKAVYVCLRLCVCAGMFVVDYFRMNCKEIKSIQNGKFASSNRFSPSVHIVFCIDLSCMRVCGCILYRSRGHQVIHTMITNNFRIINIVINYTFL